MPSTGCGSIDSTASEKSLARMPVVWIHSASTPANGPRPTATMNNMANTISLIARAASISRRTGWRTQTGAILAEDSSASGIAQTTASAVPHKAIWTVITISAR
eukprot:Amastigsp_a513194_7.p3 type:complete len:104 gc:universal Amastigsp_a513194_7:592-281(-)